MKLGFISDAHGNVGAFEQGLKILDAFGCEDVVFLGDAVGYLPDPRVVRMITLHGVTALLGNHEAMMLSDGDMADNEKVYQLRRCRETLLEADVAAIKTWPLERSISDGALDIWMMHGSPENLCFGYVYPDSDLEIYDRPKGSVTVMGNTHRPFWRCNSQGAWFLNPGSCGMPRDCGDLGSVAVLDTRDLVARILRFDIRESSRQAVTRCAPVHESVIALFERPRPQNLVGETNG